MKPLEFLGSSRDDLARMPADVRHEIGVELMRVQFGGQPTDFKPMSAVGAGVYEIRVRDASGAYRAMYVARFEVAIYVLHACQKKTQEAQGPCGSCHTGDVKFEATPIVADGRLLVSTPLNRIVALDPATGQELADASYRSTRWASSRSTRRGRAQCSRRLPNARADPTSLDSRPTARDRCERPAQRPAAAPRLLGGAIVALAA
ncbi:MAG: hypothetical protein FJ191_13445 [Gammaproteobacteria bacterium]|nr:hypothetical protein [Gammaproteobacteria bacterium]